MLVTPSFIYLDYEDIKEVMKNSNSTIIGFSETIGDKRAIKAIEAAMYSTRLDKFEILRIEKILVFIVATEESLMMDEYACILDYLQEITGLECQLKVGANIDNKLGDKIQVVLVIPVMD